MAEAVGFEPTCPCGQLHFECSSLQPLRYASMHKYSLFRTNHMISSQSRYDHFDTSPYVSQHQHPGKRGEQMGRTTKNIKLKTPENPRKSRIPNQRVIEQCPRFRVSPVMTTSIPLREQQVILYTKTGKCQFLFRQCAALTGVLSSVFSRKLYTFTNHFHMSLCFVEKTG